MELGEVRHRIYDFCSSEFPFIAVGYIELDESYVDVRWEQGKRGHGAYYNINFSCSIASFIPFVAALFIQYLAASKFL